MLDINRFSSKHPTLYHLTAPNAWPSIERIGLLSSNRALRLFEKSAVDRAAISVLRRKSSYILESSSLGSIVLRDQSPLNDSKLTNCLCEMSVNDWRALLDERVFFFARRSSIDGLRKARVCRHQPQVVIEVDTPSLFARYGNEIEVADINTGSTIHRPAARGSFTFQNIESYKKYGRRQIVEVVIKDSIPDFSEFVKRVQRFTSAKDQIGETLFLR